MSVSERLAGLFGGGVDNSTATYPSSASSPKAVERDLLGVAVPDRAAGVQATVPLQDHRASVLKYIAILTDEVLSEVLKDVVTGLNSMPAVIRHDSNVEQHSASQTIDKNQDPLYTEIQAQALDAIKQEDALQRELTFKYSSILGAESSVIQSLCGIDHHYKRKPAAEAVAKPPGAAVTKKPAEMVAQASDTGAPSMEMETPDRIVLTTELEITRVRKIERYRENFGRHYRKAREAGLDLAPGQPGVWGTWHVWSFLADEIAAGAIVEALGEVEEAFQGSIDALVQKELQ